MASRRKPKHDDDPASNRRSRSAFFAAWESEIAGGKRIAELAFGQDTPQTNVQDAIKKARYWFQYNWMVGTIVLMRLAFYNFGLKIKAADKKDADKVDEWAKREEISNEIHRYARDAWLEFLVTDNVVGVWRLKGKPIAFQAEDCEFTDNFGNEILKVELGMGPEQLKDIAGLTPGEIKAIANTGGKLQLTHANPLFSFDVVKREKIGQGFAWPGLARLFICAAQTEGQEVGDNLLGQTDRKVYEQHIMGHETRYGPMAGSKANFVNNEKAKLIEKQLKGKVGHITLATNFDHKIVIGAGRADPKFFDAKKYEGAIKKMGIWGAPLAQMFLERNLNPNLMDILKQLAALDREYIAPHLKKVFTSTLKPPAEIKIIWSNRCFKDARLAADLLKFGVQWGFISQQSAQEESGYSPDEEYARKAQEAKLPDAETQPLVDANHGDKKAAAGRKRGTPDGGK